VTQDPFADMRLDEDESSRAPFEVRELQAIFAAAVFMKDERPKGGQGEAACWLPLLALFGGERLSELTGLRVSDVAPNELIGAVAIYINEDRKAGRRLKTKQSERFIPVHPLLIELGFLDFVAAQAKARGADAWLFPLAAPGTKGTAAYSKWFGRYIGAHGVTDTAKVFHSFRHSFIDALRVANVGDEIKHALLGWSGGGIPAKYGAKDKAAVLVVHTRIGVAYKGDVDFTGDARQAHAAPSASIGGPVFVGGRVWPAVSSNATGPVRCRSRLQPPRPACVGTVRLCPSRHTLLEYLRRSIQAAHV
jgi:hypothetical protein